MYKILLYILLYILLLIYTNYLLSSVALCEHCMLCWGAFWDCVAVHFPSHLTCWDALCEIAVQFMPHQNRWDVHTAPELLQPILYCWWSVQCALFCAYCFLCTVTLSEYYYCILCCWVVMHLRSTLLWHPVSITIVFVNSAGEVHFCDSQSSTAAARKTDPEQARSHWLGAKMFQSGSRKICSTLLSTSTFCCKCSITTIVIVWWT